MKLTKREFNRIVKEEVLNVLQESEWKHSSAMRHAFDDRSKKLFRRQRRHSSPRPQAHIDLENIMISIKNAYDAQPSNEEKEQFETFLLENVMQYVEVWREERSQEDLGDL